MMVSTSARIRLRLKELKATLIHEQKKLDELKKTIKNDKNELWVMNCSECDDECECGGLEISERHTLAWFRCRFCHRDQISTSGYCNYDHCQIIMKVSLEIKQIEKDLRKRAEIRRNRGYRPRKPNKKKK